MSSIVARIVGTIITALDKQWITDGRTAVPDGSTLLSTADIANKQDTVPAATENNFASWDASGQTQDSGSKAGDFDAAGSASTVQSNLDDHELATISVHGIADTSALETATGAQAKADAAQDFAIQRANHTGTQALSTISDAGTMAAADAADYTPIDASIVSKSADYTVTAADAGKTIECTGTMTITLPDGLDTGFQVTIVPISGTNLVTADTTLQYWNGGVLTDIVGNGIANSPLYIYHAGANVWRVAFGDFEEYVATYTVTTSGADTHTINSLGVTDSTLVDWGDGSTDTYTGTATRTHNYASSGTWTVKIYPPESVTRLSLTDNKVFIYSTTLASLVNIDYFAAIGINGGEFNSVDVAAWNPSEFYLTDNPAALAGSFNFVDVAAWNPDIFQLKGLPGMSMAFDSADVAAWNPATFYLYSIGTSSISAGGGLGNFTLATSVRLFNNALSKSLVDAFLYEFYQATTTPRIVGGGSILIGGTNAAPSGTFQPASACPVTVATDGNEVAYELLNDSCGVGFNKWTTVTVTA